MTTNVPKGANRASAAARTRKHAQRTVLPARPGQVEAAREPIARIISEEDRERLDSRLVDGVHPGRAAKSASSNGEAPDARSQAKGAAFREKASSLGWNTSLMETDAGVELTATRGAETIVQAWSGGVWSYETSVYAYGDRTTKPRNASGALKLLARSAADAASEASKVVANRHFRKSEPKDIVQTLEAAQRSLPFDPGLATDEEICGTLAGQAVVWYNRIGRSNESAIVGRSGVRITYLEDGQRVANFCCPVTGYRSCLVTALLKVGRGRVRSAETAEVEVS